MPQNNKKRNEFIQGDWTLQKVTDDSLLSKFDCGNKDLNEYFQQDALVYREALISQTYHLKATEELDFPVALVDFCNDSIRLEKFKIDKPEVAEAKQHPLPAVKITRLGVSDVFRGNGLGTKVINMVKSFFLTENRTGCRFITVDAYNRGDNSAVGFYLKNDFSFFTDKDEKKQTRAMYFDLKRLPSE
jgi:GNAT superfamily N-acetyltransferase